MWHNTWKCTLIQQKTFPFPPLLPKSLSKCTLMPPCSVAFCNCDLQSGATHHSCVQGPAHSGSRVSGGSHGASERPDRRVLPQHKDSPGTSEKLLKNKQKQLHYIFFILKHNKSNNQTMNEELNCFYHLRRFKELFTTGKTLTINTLSTELQHVGTLPLITYHYKGFTNDLFILVHLFCLVHWIKVWVIYKT